MMKIITKFVEMERNGCAQAADQLVVVLLVFANDTLILETFQNNSKRGGIPVFSKQIIRLFGI